MPEPDLPEQEDEGRPTVHALLRRFGANAMSFLALESAMRHWFDAPPPLGTGGCVAFVETDAAWVAAGDPLGPPAEIAGIARRFVAAARASGKRACFVASESLAGDGFERVLLGEQPIYRPAEWRRTLATRRRLREQLRRARAKGVRVRRVDSVELDPGQPLRHEVERLAGEWLESRHMAEMRFLVALEPFHAPEEHRYFVAERDGQAVEFLSAVPIYARRGWLVEDIVRNRAAPNGTTESLLDALLRSASDDEIVTLGLAPLTGRVSTWLRAVRFAARPLYSFAGLRSFKERLRPSGWEPVWLVVPTGGAPLVHLLDSMRAFASGSLVAFGARSLVSHTSGPPFALAVALVPWTLVLAGLVGGGGESLLGLSRGSLAAWTAFDAAMVFVLLRCAMRPHPATLALATAAAATDATLSATHLVAGGLGRTPLEWALRAIAVVAPAFGAVALAWATMRALARALPEGAPEREGAS